MSSVPVTSLAAYHSLGPGIASLRDQIVDFIESCGSYGAISDDVFKHLSVFGKNDSSITTRYSELVGAGLIYRAGDTRPGKSCRQQQVMRHAKFKTIVPPLPPKPTPKSPVFKKGAAWGLRRAAKIILANPIFKATPEALALVAEIRSIEA